ncbi:hypothetical protein [Geodermatophilus sp. CPCC 206100]|uniref:hypothetical protein n=1 Tax=Geodermatophilus sp. CPCC 206100 TaxID=3020054 RepID=UPI003B002A7D
MEAVLLWPSVAVLGFLAMAGLIIGLGRGSTARYEYERNSVAQQPQSAAVGAPAPATSAGAVGAGASTVESARLPERGGAAAPASPRGSRTAVAADTARRTTAQRPSAPGWWLVDECAEQPGARIVAGPFGDSIDAEWAALANGLADTTRAVYGQQRADGALVGRQTPDERAWLAELDAHLDRLPEDWDALLSDTDALTTLVVEVGAALVEAGLPLHDCSGRGADGAAGGVCLTPDVANFGVLVSWHAHDRLSVHQARGAAADAAVTRTLGAAVADVLVQLGFAVEAMGPGPCYRVTPRPQD